MRSENADPLSPDEAPPGGARARRVEALRKAVHVSCVLFAIPLRWLPWKGALLLTSCALLFNAAVLPHAGGRALHRPGEERRGWSAGILLYPASLALLTLVFRDRLEFVGAAWALMALGDGMATVVGATAGRQPLPWNRGKTWEGALAHALFGGVGAALLMAWIAGDLSGASPGTASLLGRPVWLVAGLGAALLTAWLETLDAGIDDNVLVPLAGGGTCWFLHALVTGAGSRDWNGDLERAVLALGACVVLAIAAAVTGALGAGGAVAAALLGAVVAGFGGWPSFTVLAAFFLVGTAATRVGRARKEELGIAEARGGRRGVGNVLANGGLAGACALLVVPGPAADLAPLAGLVLVAALATAAFDTVSSEVGKACGRRTILPTTGRLVPPGTEGAVSLEGTAAGTAAALLLGGVGLAVGLLPADGWREGAGVVLIVGSGAFLGSLFESVVGAWSAGRGLEIDNDLINFANTLVGGLAAAGLYLA